MSQPNLPSRRLSREALERVIQRAAELQAHEIDTGEGVTEQELLKLGAEVGIDGRYLRQALYEDRAGAGGPGERGVLAKWVGPGHVHASRVVQAPREEVERQLEHWMDTGELMTIKRRQPDRISWERRKGFVAEMKRGLGVGGHDYQLAKTKEVTAAITPLESGYCHVEMAADITGQRAGFVGGAAAVGGVGAAGVLLTGGLGAPLVIPILIAGAFGPGAWAIARQHLRVVERAQLALEQVLDRLERGEIKPQHQAGSSPFAPLGRIAEEITRAISDGTDAARRARRFPPR